MPPSSPLAIDIRCGDFPAGTLSSDVAKWLVDYFVAETGHPIASVQEFSGKIARVTFGPGVKPTRRGFSVKGKSLLMMLSVKLFFLPRPLRRTGMSLYFSTLMRWVMIFWLKS